MRILEQWHALAGAHQLDFRVRVPVCIIVIRTLFLIGLILGSGSRICFVEAESAESAESTEADTAAQSRLGGRDFDPIGAELPVPQVHSVELSIDDRRFSIEQRVSNRKSKIDNRKFQGVGVPVPQAHPVGLHDTLRIVHLSGSPYELGYQHGSILREEVRASVSRILQYFHRYLKLPFIRSWLASLWLAKVWQKARPFVAADYLEELRGLSDGSGVALRELYQLHAIPDRTYACSGFAAWGRATEDGRLIHLRNLDWNIDAGIQEFATLFVVRPQKRHAFVNVGWAGFIGVLTGVNDRQLSIGQIGSETVDATFRGEPMVFVMRRVMEQANDLDSAIAIINLAPRTVGVNYVLADAKARRAVVMETTHRHCRAFEANDPGERAVSYARPLVDAVLRADTAMDPQIRNLQLASNGDPNRAGLEDPTGSSAYDVRYLGQAAGLSAHFGSLTPQKAQQIARTVGPSSNVQSVIIAWPELWVANAHGKTRATAGRFQKLSLEHLFATFDTTPVDNP